MHINPNLPDHGGLSPFDAIRRVTPEGREYWSARDLMPLLGYDSWRRFADAIKRAQVAAKNSGHEVTRLFAGAVKKSDGRDAEDHHLARFACYLVAMSGDPRKPEVAAALSYFAVKTREAETAQPQLDLTDPDVALDKIIELASMAKDERAGRLAAEATARALTVRVEKDAPLVAKAEAHTGSDSAVHRQEFAREVITWGMRQKNIVIKQADVFRFLGHIGLFIRGERTDTGHATSDALKRGLAFTDKGTAKNGHAWATGKLTAKGQDYAWGKVIAHVEANGTLELPRELRGGDPA